MYCILLKSDFHENTIADINVDKNWILARYLSTTWITAFKNDIFIPPSPHPMLCSEVLHVTNLTYNIERVGEGGGERNPSLKLTIVSIQTLLRNYQLFLSAIVFFSILKLHRAKNIQHVIFGIKLNFRH